MPAQLLALSGGEPILLDRPIMVFGRHPECDVQLNSRKVSRRHCCIAQVSDYLVVRDLGSTNGIRINNEKVNEGKLRHGDELTVGNFRYQVCWDGVPAPAPASRPQMPAVPAPLKAAGKPVAKPPIEDEDDLENAEEPVALDETDSKADDLPAAPAPGARPPAKGAAPPPPPAKGRPAGPFVLPENLTLAPLSGDRKPPQRPGDPKPS